LTDLMIISGQLVRLTSLMIILGGWARLTGLRSIEIGRYEHMWKIILKGQSEKQEHPSRIHSKKKDGSCGKCKSEVVLWDRT
jgi:hypothetical protein